MLVLVLLMAVSLIRAGGWAATSQSFHSIDKQYLFYKHFLSIFNVLVLRQGLGDTFMSKKWALPWRRYQFRRGILYVNGKSQWLCLSLQARYQIECCGDRDRNNDLCFDCGEEGKWWSTYCWPGVFQKKLRVEHLDWNEESFGECGEEHFSWRKDIKSKRGYKELDRIEFELHVVQSEQTTYPLRINWG